MTVGDDRPDIKGMGPTMRRLVWEEFARDSGARADFARHMDKMSDRILSMSGPQPDQRARAMEIAQAILRLKDELLRPSVVASRSVHGPDPVQ